VDAARGEHGEMRTRAALEPLQGLGWRVLHDVGVGTPTRANVDHIAIGPGGVWVVETKCYAGDLEYDADKRRLIVGGTDRAKKLWYCAVAALMDVKDLPELAPIRPSVRPLVVLHADQGEIVDVLPVGIRRRSIVDVTGPTTARELIESSELSPNSRRKIRRDELSPKAIAALAELLPGALAGVAPKTLHKAEPPAEMWFCPHCGEDLQKPAPQTPQEPTNARSRYQDTGTSVPTAGHAPAAGKSTPQENDPPAEAEGSLVRRTGSVPVEVDGPVPVGVDRPRPVELVGPQRPVVVGVVVPVHDGPGVVLERPNEEPPPDAHRDERQPQREDVLQPQPRVVLEQRDHRHVGHDAELVGW
jgi:hypothetical protein